MSWVTVACLDKSGEFAGESALMTEPSPTLYSVIENIETWLRHEISMGRLTTSVPPEVLASVARLENTPVSTPVTEPESIDTVIREVSACTLCPLHSTRTNTVPGEGALQPDVMFIGEGPGAAEDAEGRPFIGRAGKLLTKMIEAMGYEREEIYIANIVKCRPPENRVPSPEELSACMPYLKRQIAIVQPKVIVALGATAVKGLLDVKTGISLLRGNWHTFEGIDLMPTFHPAYLLRNPPKKKEAWEDLQAVLEKVGRTAPPLK